MRKAQAVLAQAFAPAIWTITKPQDGHQKECYVATDGSRTVFIKFDVPLQSLQRLSELGVAPHMLASGAYQGEDYVIQEYLDGVYPDRLWLRSHIGKVATLIRTYHDDGPLADILAHDGAVSYRQHLDQDMREIETRVANQANNAPLRSAFQRLKELSLSLGAVPLTPVHNEPNTKNMLVHGGKLTFIDWDETLLSDPMRDIGVFLWWYLPIPQWSDFFSAYGVPFTPAEEAKIYWFAARASLVIYLWHVEHGHSGRGFYEDFIAALNRRPNPHGD